MAKRYSGSLQINVSYDNRGFYRTSVSEGGKKLWSGQVNPAPAGFGVGVAYDSPQAYDEIARSALSFADHEVPDAGIGDSADFQEDGSGWRVTRASGGSSASGRREGGGGGGGRSPARLEREVQDYLGRSR
jgi:hypothetical protein